MNVLLTLEKPPVKLAGGEFDLYDLEEKVEYIPITTNIELQLYQMEE